MPKLKIPKPVAEGYTIIQKAFVSRLKPNGATEQLFDKIAGTCRFVYNGAVHQRRAFYDMGLKTPTAFDQIKFLTQAKHNPDLAFLSDAPIHCLQQAMVDVATAFDNFFADLKKQAAGLLKAKDVRRPKKHKKGKCRDSFRFPDAKQFVIKRKRVKLPKIGWVNFFDSRKIEGTPKSVTVFKDGQHWFMSVLCEVIAPIPAQPTGEAIGIDLNVEEGAAVALSDGRCLETAKTSKRERRFLRKLKRTVSRRIKGSERYAKAVARLAKFEKYRSSRRKDSIHKITTQLAKTHGAERNLICQVARRGNVSLEGSTVYLLATDSTGLIWGGPPCTACTIHLIQCGIKHIRSLPFKEGPSAWREDVEYARSLLSEASVTYSELQGVVL